MQWTPFEGSLEPLHLFVLDERKLEQVGFIGRWMIPSIPAIYMFMQYADVRLAIALLASGTNSREGYSLPNYQYRCPLI